MFFSFFKRFQTSQVSPSPTNVGLDAPDALEKSSFKSSSATSGASNIISSAIHLLSKTRELLSIEAVLLHLIRVSDFPQYIRNAQHRTLEGCITLICSHHRIPTGRKLRDATVLTPRFKLFGQQQSLVSRQTSEFKELVEIIQTLTEILIAKSLLSSDKAALERIFEQVARLTKLQTQDRLRAFCRLHSYLRDLEFDAFGSPIIKKPAQRHLQTTKDDSEGVRKQSQKALTVRTAEHTPRTTRESKPTSYAQANLMSKITPAVKEESSSESYETPSLVVTSPSLVTLAPETKTSATIKASGSGVPPPPPPPPMKNKGRIRRMHVKACECLDVSSTLWAQQLTPSLEAVIGTPALPDMKSAFGATGTRLSKKVTVQESSVLSPKRERILDILHHPFKAQPSGFIVHAVERGDFEALGLKAIETLVAIGAPKTEEIVAVEKVAQVRSLLQGELFIQQMVKIDKHQERIESMRIHLELPATTEDLRRKSAVIGTGARAVCQSASLRVALSTIRRAVALIESEPLTVLDLNSIRGLANIKTSGGEGFYQWIIARVPRLQETKMDECLVALKRASAFSYADIQREVDDACKSVKKIEELQTALTEGDAMQTSLKMIVEKANSHVSALKDTTRQCKEEVEDALRYLGQTGEWDAVVGAILDLLAQIKKAHDDQLRPSRGISKRRKEGQPPGDEQGGNATPGDKYAQKSMKIQFASAPQQPLNLEQELAKVRARLQGKTQ